MARPRSKKVQLYLKKGRPEWWVRFTLPPEVDRHFEPPPTLPEANGHRPSADGRVAMSLQTTDKRAANALRDDLQAALTAAYKGAVTHEFVDKILRQEGKTVRSLAEFFTELETIEAERVQRWHVQATPAARRQKRALAPETFTRLKLIRSYLLEALAALYPGQSFNVNHFSDDQRRRPNVLKIREWIIDTRGIERETYKQFRSYFSGAWRTLALRNGYADRNPWEHPDMRPQEATATERATLTVEQRAAILTAPSTWANNATKLLVLTGLRPSEIPWLMRTSFNAEHNRYDVIQSKVGGAIKPMPNTPDVAAVIANQLKILDELGLADCNWIFPRVWNKAERGQQSHREQVCKTIDRALLALLGTKKDRLGRPISPYTLRRTFATVLGRQAKTNPHDIADLMGHKNIQQQMTYSQIDDDALYQSALASQVKIRGG